MIALLDRGSWMRTSKKQNLPTILKKKLPVRLIARSFLLLNCRPLLVYLFQSFIYIRQRVLTIMCNIKPAPLVGRFKVPFKLLEILCRRPVRKQSGILTRFSLRSKFVLRAFVRPPGHSTKHFLRNHKPIDVSTYFYFKTCQSYFLENK